MNFDKNDTAVVFIDPQNDVLSEKGLSWPLLHESLKENNTIENMERIFKAAKAYGYEVFISPHYFYPTDRGWKFNGPLETDEVVHNEFGRKGVLTLDGFKGSGADWLERFKPYIEDGKTIVVSPHRVWGPESNDLVLQLRKRRISKIILGGMLANMCVESHLRELVEQGFEVAVGLWLHGCAHQLCIHRTCCPYNGGGGQGDGARSAVGQALIGSTTGGSADLRGLRWSC
jgi:nicotinamidase-related amidase